MIYPGKGRPHLRINYQNKKFSRDWIPARDERLEELSKFSGNADRELGTRMIDGHKAFGFEVDAKEIDPWAGPGKAEIWLDATSTLPIRCRVDAQNLGLGVGLRVRS